MATLIFIENKHWQLNFRADGKRHRLYVPTKRVGEKLVMMIKENEDIKKMRERLKFYFEEEIGLLEYEMLAVKQFIYKKRLSPVERKQCRDIYKKVLKRSGQ